MPVWQGSSARMDIQGYLTEIRALAASGQSSIRMGTQ
jgi:hypothetical protein